MFQAKVVIADDHPLFRTALKQAIIECIDEANTLEADNFSKLLTQTFVVTSNTPRRVTRGLIATEPDLRADCSNTITVDRETSVASDVQIRIRIAISVGVLSVRDLTGVPRAFGLVLRI